MDEELLALRVPPPSPRQALFIGLVLCLSVFMLIWFFPDLRFWLRAFEEPLDLGEAADADPGGFHRQALVRLHGIPMTNRTLVFSKGVRWFSDTERKIFPLAGRPELLVEWRIPDEHRAYRDPYVNPGEARLPFDFEGRLVPRGELGPRYERVWLFYDCLEGWSGRECKLCLGAEDLGQCRRRIACALEIGEDCRAILSNPGDPRAAAVQRKADELALDEARRFHERLTGTVEKRRRAAEERERDLADLESGRMVPRLEDEIARWKAKLAEVRDEEARLLERLSAERGLDREGLRTATERAAGELEQVRVEIRDLVRRAEAARADGGTPDAGATEDATGRLAELEVRRDALQTRVEEDRGLFERLRELARLARERAESVADLEGELRAARSGELAAGLRAGRDRAAAVPAAVVARLEESGRRLEGLPPGSPEVAAVLRELGGLQAELGHSQWVLMDGEVPADSAWVLAVYLLFLVMIVANLRHLYRFWLAWRE